MTFRHVMLVAAVLAIPVASPACSDDTSNPAEALYGDWRTGLDGYFLTFEPDGSWTVAQGEEQEPFDTGMFTFDGSTLTVDTADGSESCQPGQTGMYEVTFVDDDTVDLERIRDDCSARGSDFGSGLTQVDG